MKKIAIPVTHDLLDPHFGHCKEFHMFEVEDQTIIREYKHPAPPHEPGYLPKWLHQHQVSDVIAGGMGQRAIALFLENNINVFVGAPVNPPASVVKNFLNGNLVLRENYCNH
jgi:predicted Fe-Mo cluster-binding NifX family protein